MKNSLFTRIADVLKPKPKEAPLFDGRELTLPELRKIILDPLHDFARSKGFEPTKGNYDVWLRQRSDITWDRLAFSLNEKYKSEWIWSDPGVGVQCPTVHKFLEQITGVKYKEISGVIVIQIGYVMPKREYTEWKFPRAGSLQSTIDDMLAALEKYGVPFMEQFTDYRSMLAVRRLEGLVPMQPEVVSALQYLDGDKEAALATMLNEPELSLDLDNPAVSEETRKIKMKKNQIRQALIEFYSS
jgi:hypothetical protein